MWPRGSPRQHHRHWRARASLRTIRPRQRRPTLQKNMQLRLSPERLDDRAPAPGRFLDRLNRQIESTDRALTVDRLHEQAYQLLLSRGVADALDLSQGIGKVVARYDTSHFARTDNWSKAARGQAAAITPATPDRWASSCCWLGGCARPAVAS